MSKLANKLQRKVSRAKLFIEEQLDQYNRIEVLNSFGKDSIVVCHLTLPYDLTNVWIKPPFLPEETTVLADEVTDLWNLELRVLEADITKDEEVMDTIIKQPNLPKSNPETCCALFKVEPIMKYVRETGLPAWFSGLRATEAECRNHFTQIWEQGKNALVKLHPVIDWSEEEIWTYIEGNDLPYHPWYDQGYRSLGCEPCSSSGGATEREGRWCETMLQGGGCGIHRTVMERSEHESNKAS